MTCIEGIVEALWYQFVKESIWIKTTIIIPAIFVFVIDFVNYVNVII